MLLAEELALVAIDDDSGRPALGTRDQLNACLAGLLIAELVLEGVAAPGDKNGTVVLTGTPASSQVLSAAADVIAEKGPKVKAALSHMSRGLDQRLGSGTWDAVVGGLETAGDVGPEEGAILHRRHVLDREARNEIVDRLRAAAASDEPLDARTAVLLSMTGPAALLEVVAPDRGGRKHARRRIDHALDATDLQPIGDLVRRVLADAAAAAAAASVAAVGATAAST